MAQFGDWHLYPYSAASVRRFLAAAAVASVALLVYASLVPLNYQPLSWEETWQAWRQIPWLSLDVYHRADWVANALVVLPAGFLAAAAIDWNRDNSWPLLLATPVITFALILVVIAIEMVQVWFPPRTVSLNDVVAGFVGAALGPVLWAISGPTIERGFTNFYTLPRHRDRLASFCVFWLVCLLIYSLLPLDLMVTRVEWQEKLAAGRLEWNPLQHQNNWQTNIYTLSRAALTLAPVGFLCSIALKRPAGLVVWLLPLLVQLIQLPFFSRSLSPISVVGGWIGGWFGYWLARHLDRLSPLAGQPIVWAIGWSLANALALADLLGRYDRVVLDPTEIKARLSTAWSWPLVNYYADSEFHAYSNMIEKMGVFALIGAAAAGWALTLRGRRRSMITWLTCLTVLVLAIGIEILQACLPPTVPDMSEVIVYLIGYTMGFYLMSAVGIPGPASVHPDDDSDSVANTTFSGSDIELS